MPKVIPFGDRILVKRRKVGEKIGSLHLPDSIKERATDLADVVYVPDLTFSDTEILENSDNIIREMVKRAKNGSIEAVEAMLKLNVFIKLKSIKVGDGVMISKYVGTDFHETGETDTLTLVNTDDIIGLVVK